MTRATQTAATLLVGGAVWLLVVFHHWAFPSVAVPAVVDVVSPIVTFHSLFSHRERSSPNGSTQIPLWLIVSFGAYLLAAVGWGLATFRDCPEAHTELLAQIKQARAELKL